MSVEHCKCKLPQRSPVENEFLYIFRFKNAPDVICETSIHRVHKWGTSHYTAVSKMGLYPRPPRITDSTVASPIIFVSRSTSSLLIASCRRHTPAHLAELLRSLTLNGPSSDDTAVIRYSETISDRLARSVSSSRQIADDSTSKTKQSDT